MMKSTFAQQLSTRVVKCLSVAFAATVILIGTVQPQQFSITAGTITTCAGVLEDSGGPNGQYGNGENFTVVICPDNPGDGISLNWLVANLSNTGPNPVDRLRI